MPYLLVFGEWQRNAFVGLCTWLQHDPWAIPIAESPLQKCFRCSYSELRCSA